MKEQSIEQSIEQSGRMPWQIAAMAGLAANALGPLLAMALDQRFAAIGLIFVVIPLVAAGLMLTRSRLLVGLVVLVSAVLLIGAIQSPTVGARLANPASIGYFAVALLQLGGSAVATVASLLTLGRSAPARAAG